MGQKRTNHGWEKNWKPRYEAQLRIGPKKKVKSKGGTQGRTFLEVTILMGIMELGTKKALGIGKNGT